MLLLFELGSIAVLELLISRLMLFVVGLYLMLVLWLGRLFELGMLWLIVYVGLYGL